MLGKKNIFLAGSTGMVGTSILRYILDYSPVTRIRAVYHVAGPVIKHRRIDYVHGDLSSPDYCRKMVRGCDCAIMAAAYTGGAGFIRLSPWEHMRKNLIMNMQMLDAFRLEKIKRVIFVGSAALYQESEGSMKEEGLDLNKEPPKAYFSYAWGMRFIEKLCKFINENYGIEVIIVRSANIFGPYDKFKPNISNFIPALIRKAVDKMDPFEVWGSHHVIRDVLYVDDFARAIVMMVEDTRIKFDTFNLGSGVKTTVGDVVRWALKYARHIPSQIRYMQDKPTTIKFRLLDCTKVKRFLGWKPKYSIEEGIKKTSEWWVENKDTWKK